MELQIDDLQPEYDFTKMKGGVRGKYRKAYQERHSVQIHKPDGSVEMHHFTLEDGAVIVASGVLEYFPTSESVNEALRGLIKLIPHRSSKP